MPCSSLLVFLPDQSWCKRTRQCHCICLRQTCRACCCRLFSREDLHLPPHSCTVCPFRDHKPRQMSNRIPVQTTKTTQSLLVYVSPTNCLFVRILSRQIHEAFTSPGFSHLQNLSSEHAFESTGQEPDGHFVSRMGRLPSASHL